MTKLNKMLSASVLLAITGGGATLNAAPSERLATAQQEAAEAKADLQKEKERLRELEEEYRNAPASKKAELKKEIAEQKRAVKEAQRDNKLAVKSVKQAANKNNQSGAFVGGETALGFGSTKLIGMPAGYVTVKDGVSVAVDFDIKGGYKFYFNDHFGVRAHGGLGYSTRIAAVAIDGGPSIAYTTAGLKFGLGADALVSVSGSFGIFAGGGLDIHNWNHTISPTSGEEVKLSGTTTIPKFQVGLRFGGFELAVVRHLSAIQPSKRLDDMTFGNATAVKMGYYYSF